jgi:flavoprotein
VEFADISADREVREMSELRDDFRYLKERRRQFRRHMHECPKCAIAYGTGTKVVPGEKCRNCEWVAPAHSALTGAPWSPKSRA